MFPGPDEPKPLLLPNELPLLFPKLLLLPLCPFAFGGAPCCPKPCS